MIERRIMLNDTKDLFEFARLANRCEEDVIVYTDNDILKTGSILRLCRADISKPLKVEFYGDIPGEVKEGMKKFIVN